MIEVVLLGDERQSPYPLFGIAIDGVVEPKEKAYLAPSPSVPDEYELLIYDGGVAEGFMRQIWWDIPASIIGVDMVLDRHFDWMGFDHSVMVGLITSREHFLSADRVTITVKILFDRGTKNAAWRLMRYYGVLTRFASDDYEYRMQDHGRPDDYRWDYECNFLPDDFGFTFSLKLSDAPTAVKDPFSKFETVVRDLHEAAIKEIGQRGDENSVSLLFDFPEAVRVPCEQYLQYFAQFLKDAGVGATADLTHQAGQILFTVTPDNQDVALDKIRKALDLYLHLPGNKSFAMTPYFDESIAVQRMGITLQTFQNQVQLLNLEIRQLEAENRANKQQVIDAQQAAMQAFQFALNRQAPIGAEAFVDSVKAVTAKHQEGEQVKVGVVAIKNYDGGWFAIDAAEIARSLKLPEIAERVRRFFKSPAG